MHTDLKYVDPTRPVSGFARAYASIAATPAAKFISRHVNWKLDVFLLRVTRGRFATTLVFPTALLETRGAKTGVIRRNAIIYFHDADRVVIVASNAGAAHHPAWYYNLLIHPDVSIGGVRMHAAEVEEPTEQERLWALADHVFPAFRQYRNAAAKQNRTIPIIQLTRTDLK